MIIPRRIQWSVKRVFCSVLGLGLMALASIAQAENIAVHAGWLFDSENGRLLEKRTVHIVDGRVEAVERGFTQRQGERVIDLSGFSVLPGLMDMHTHLSYEFGPRTYSEAFTWNPADYTLRAVNTAERTLMAGFTTVRDLGDSDNVTISLRNAIKRGDVVGPRVFTAGKSIATTGGHADPSNGYRQDLMGSPGPAEGVVNGVASARQAVRQRYKDGADLIKITATGGVLSVAKSGQNPQFMQDEVEAIVATAKDYGFTVAVHAHGKEGMERAIRAGVDSVEHGTYMDDETMEMMIDHGTWYVPTMLAGDWVTQKSAVDGFFPDMVRTKAAKIGPLIRDTFNRAHKKGVKIAFGTDTGVSRHGENAKEFALMVEGGMSPADAIRSATWNAAQLLNAQDELGSIAPGKHADLVGVIGNPLEDITTLERVRFVMKGGTVYKQPE
ncbi:metal-dependent hydrolase family protein [Microbulbifer hydrolyticus]|uniref:Imidazolonepropionase-like amidohydrolase n=2 Tax=Microbulbifer hydrolyticus TaxID=48074 RepID=A0AA89P8Q5_9GAMM|nr:amidohydrolase family protein [Microbulbifer hydrolyticus]MBB5210028.1 imidazolonepropionase-like amidohydrolase [Microbulbifer hydrolyticus]